MLILFIILFLGIAIGFFFRKVKFIGKFGDRMSVTVLLMLFTFGINIGGDSEIMGDMDQLGIAALVISILGIVGSCIFALLIHRFLNRRKGEGK